MFLCMSFLHSFGTVLVRASHTCSYEQIHLFLKDMLRPSKNRKYFWNFPIVQRFKKTAVACEFWKQIKKIHFSKVVVQYIYIYIFIYLFIYLFRHISNFLIDFWRMTEIFLVTTSVFFFRWYSWDFTYSKVSCNLVYQYRYAIHFHIKNFLKKQQQG